MIRWRNRGNKYGAVKTVVAGITFDSKAEARRYQELKLLEKAKVISPVVIHPRYPIVLKDKSICDVVLDFSYFNYELDRVIHEDVKGQDNALSRLKRKLVEAFYTIKVDVISANTRLKKR